MTDTSYKLINDMVIFSVNGLFRNLGKSHHCQCFLTVKVFQHGKVFQMGGFVVS